MQKLTDPNECYQYLQEAKPKHVTEEPKEKLQEVLKLYEKTIDILETTQIEMQLEGKLLLYGMTLPEVEDKLSEVLAEKMQLEDCLQPSANISVNMEESDNIQFRMYEEEYPSIGDIVMVKIVSVNEVEVRGELVEYNHLPGVIMLSELSRNRIRSLSKFIRPGHDEVAIVLNANRGVVELSKKKVTSDEIAECKEKYRKSKIVHSLFRQLASRIADGKEVPVRDIFSDLCSTVSWPMYRRYGHAYDALMNLVRDDVNIFEETVSEGLRGMVRDMSRSRLTPTPVTMRAEIDVTCFEKAGIDAIKDALMAGQRCGSDDKPIIIRYVASPTYEITLVTQSPKSDMAFIQRAIDKVRDVINENGGTLKVKLEPYIIDDKKGKEVETVDEDDVEDSEEEEN